MDDTERARRAAMLAEFSAPLRRPEPSDDLEPPPELSTDAQAEWRRVIAQLPSLTNRLDRASLLAYCQAYAKWTAARRALAVMEGANPTGGLLVKVKGSEKAVPNPLLAIADSAQAEMVRYAALVRKIAGPEADVLLA